MPHLDDLVIRHAVEEHSGEAHLPPRWRVSPEMALVGARNRQIGGHEVTLGDEIMDRDLPVRKCATLPFQGLERVIDRAPTFRVPSRKEDFAVDKLVEHSQVATMHLFVEAPDNPFILFQRPGALQRPSYYPVDRPDLVRSRQPLQLHLPRSAKRELSAAFDQRL